MQQLPLPFKYLADKKAETIAKLFHYQFGFFTSGGVEPGLNWAKRDIRKGGWILYLKKDFSGYHFKRAPLSEDYKIILSNTLYVPWQSGHGERADFEGFSPNEILKYVSGEE